MKEIVIRKGVYGLRNAAGRVTPVARGERAVVSDREAERLMALGVAACTDTPVSAPVPPPEGRKPLETGVDTPDEKPVAQPAVGGGETKPDPAEVARLERMQKADLEQMARDMGVDLSGAKNNRERAMLLAAETVEDCEDASDLSMGDIVP